MLIKAVKFEEAVKRISFVKNMNKKETKKWLKDRNVIEADEIFIVIDSERKVGIKIHTVGTPKEIEIDFKY